MVHSQNYSRSYIQQSKVEKTVHVSKNTLFFVWFAILWEIAAIIIIGLLFGYDTSLTTLAGSNFILNYTILAALLLFMVAGFTLMSAYVSLSSGINMTFSIVVALFTLQNWFIFRCFWYKTGLPKSPMSGSFNGQRFTQISFLPFGNYRQLTSDYSSQSFYQAIGACIAMFAALTPLLGRIGFLEIFYLSWIGPFFYEINSSIFNKFYIVDNGFGMRGFLFGGLLGLFISIIIGSKAESKSRRFASHYQVQALTLIGTVLVCLTYPTVISAGILIQIGVPTLSAVAQINIWFALAGSIVGVYTACSLKWRKLYIHDVVFTSLSGAIAFSSSTTINFNPGAAIAIGSAVGFFCSLIHTPFKRWMNKNGVLEANSVIVQFIIPGFIACIMSSILQAVNQSSISSASIGDNRDPGRGPSGQAGWQLIGFCFSLGSSLICAVIIGLLMKCLHKPIHNRYFNDHRFIKTDDTKYDDMELESKQDINDEAA